MEKMTKRNVYEALVNLANGTGLVYEAEGEMVVVTNEALLAFAENEIEQLDKKAAKAKERAAAKKAEADELMIKVKAVLTNEFRTLPEITADIEDEEVSVAKVQYRLSQLVKAGEAEKTDITVEGEDGKKRKVKGYKISE